MGKKKKQKVTEQQITDSTGGQSSSGENSGWQNALSEMINNATSSGAFDTKNYSNNFENVNRNENVRNNTNTSQTGRNDFSNSSDSNEYSNSVADQSNNTYQDDSRTNYEDQSQDTAQDQSQLTSQEEIRRAQQESQLRNTAETAQRSETGVDSESQDYVRAMRGNALSSLGGIKDENFAASAEDITDTAESFQNPYTEKVVDGIRGEYDYLRGKARVATAQGATNAGAYGGGRHGVAEGERLAALDRSQASDVGGALERGYNSALSLGADTAQRRANAPVAATMARQQMLAGGLGPTGTSTSGTGTQTGMTSGTASDTSSGTTAGTMRGNTSGTMRGNTAGTSRGTTSGSMTGRTNTGTRGGRSGTERGVQNTSSNVNSMSDTNSSLFGSTAGGQSGGQSGTQFNTESGRQNGSSSGKSGGLFNQKGDQWNKGKTNSTREEESSNPWYQDAMGIAAGVGGLMGPGALGKFGKKIPLGGRVRSIPITSGIPAKVPSSLSRLRVKPRTRRPGT